MVSNGYIKCVEYCKQVKNSNNGDVLSSISNKLIIGYLASCINCMLACFLCRGSQEMTQTRHI